MSTFTRLASRIVTSYSPLPACASDFDWIATRDGYEPGDPIGYGATEEAAIAALKEQEADDE